MKNYLLCFSLRLWIPCLVFSTWTYASTPTSCQTLYEKLILSSLPSIETESNLKIGLEFPYWILKTIQNKEQTLGDPRFKDFLARLGLTFHESGRLRPTLDFVTKELVRRKVLKVTEAQRVYVVDTVSTAVHAELQQRGRTRDGIGRTYQSWTDLAVGVHQQVNKNIRVAHGVSSPEFIQSLETLAETSFKKSSKVELLIDGPASFKKRGELIDAAQNEILIMSWAIQDDLTGQWLRERLIKKRTENPKVKIKVMVDGQTALRQGYHSELIELEKNGIEVIRWKSPDQSRPFDGQHRKALIVDGSQLVAGGLNWGDAYSHLNPTAKPWRDTDLGAQGSLAEDTRQLFVDLWNEQVRIHKLSAEVLTPRQVTSLSDGQGVFAVINHRPGQGENILKTVVASIRAARSEIIIENAYFISDPVIEGPLKEAMARGVKVKILTNSAESVDEPVVSRPILKSAEKFRQAGAEVYLKQGKFETLHSKVMLVDGEFGWVGSQNFHPRSFRYEGEVVFAFQDKDLGAKTYQMIQQDLLSSKRVHDPIEIKKDPLADLQEDLFFDQL